MSVEVHHRYHRRRVILHEEEDTEWEAPE